MSKRKKNTTSYYSQRIKGTENNRNGLKCVPNSSSIICSTQNCFIDLSIFCRTQCRSSTLHNNFTELFMYEILHYFHHLHGLFLDPLKYVPASLALGSPELDRVLWVWPHQSWAEEKDHLPWVAGSTSPNAAHKAMSLLAVSVHCWCMFNVVSTRMIPRSFSAGLLSTCSVPRIYWSQELFLTRCRT